VEDPLDLFDEDIHVEGEEAEQDSAAGILQDQSGSVVVRNVLLDLAQLYLLANGQSLFIHGLQNQVLASQLGLVLTVAILGLLLRCLATFASDIDYFVHDELLPALALLQQGSHLQCHLTTALAYLKTPLTLVIVCFVRRKKIGVGLTQRQIQIFAFLALFALLAIFSLFVLFAFYALLILVRSALRIESQLGIFVITIGFLLNSFL